MRMFPIPFDISKEDKIIGGKLSIRQLLWFSLPVILLLVLFLANTGYLERTTSGIKIRYLSLTIRLFVLILAVIVSVIMNYVKINMQNADSYFIKLLKYWFRHKTFRYGR